MARLLFHVGGAPFHPVEAQARQVGRWLAGTGHAITLAQGEEAFDLLADHDVFVVMGLYHTGQTAPPAYRPLGEARRTAFERFVRRGGAVLAHHGGVASYDDWPAFMRLVGFGWVWGRSQHSRFGTHRVRITDAGHPVTAGVRDFVVEDEIYYDLWMDPGARVHAVSTWDGADRPMVCTLEGREGAPGGRVVYLANGHDLRAFGARSVEAGADSGDEALELRRLWLNAVAWLTAAG